MVIGSANSELPVTKLSITKVGVPGSEFRVLYNPTDYTIERQVKYSKESGADTDAPNIQFLSGGAEILTMNLFFDSMNASDEAGVGTAEKDLLRDNSLKSSAQKLDVRQYTSKVYNLMFIDPSKHVPPLLRIKWASLQFEGYLSSCKQTFTKFNESGTPVRAILNTVFVEYIKPSEVAERAPKQSPDTSKYRTKNETDSLWAYAGREYGSCDRWRDIATANNIDNPRLLESGRILRLPAID